MRHLNVCIQSKYILCLCIDIYFSFQLWLVFSTMNRIKNGPLTIIKPQAHKKLNPALVTYYNDLIIYDHTVVPLKFYN